MQEEYPHFEEGCSNCELRFWQGLRELLFEYGASYQQDNLAAVVREGCSTLTRLDRRERH